MVKIVIAALAKGMAVANFTRTLAEETPYASKREVHGKWVSTCSALLVQRKC